MTSWHGDAGWQRCSAHSQGEEEELVGVVMLVNAVGVDGVAVALVGKLDAGACGHGDARSTSSRGEEAKGAVVGRWRRGLGSEPTARGLPSSMTRPRWRGSLRRWPESPQEGAE
jgi:hypothetical protein